MRSLHQVIAALISHHAHPFLSVESTARDDFRLSACNAEGITECEGLLLHVHVSAKGAAGFTAALSVHGSCIHKAS